MERKKVCVEGNGGRHETTLRDHKWPMFRADRKTSRKQNARDRFRDQGRLFLTRDHYMGRGESGFQFRYFTEHRKERVLENISKLYSYLNQRSFSKSSCKIYF